MKAKVEPRVCTVLIAATEKEVARRMISRNTSSMFASRVPKSSATTNLPPPPALAIS